MTFHFYMREHLINMSYLKNKLHKLKGHLYKTAVTNHLTKNSLCLSFKTKKAMYFFRK